jgi:hypothetical protein
MFKNRHIHTLQWLFGSLLIVLFTACSSSGEEDGVGGSATHKPALLTIYVYSPESAATNRQSALSRADTGNVQTVGEEAAIDSLQIWIYESESKAFVGYLSTSEVATLNMGEGATYQLPVSDEFAQNKPNVDVYVLANVTASNCGVGVLNSDISHEGLMTGAKIAYGHYGLEELVNSVPDEGLPMAGKLTVLPVVGDAPALRVGTMSQVATVPLTRAVSKLRFVFAKTTGQPTVNITSITMNANMIPTEEHLFRTPTSMTYNTTEAGLLSTSISDVAETADPTNYIYFNQEAQAYENLINTAGLTVHGPIYLRESDKQLAGTITYTIDDGEPQTADFQMQQAGDFLRNHTWIVYAYYAGSGRLQVQSLYVKDWSEKEMPYNFYNW